VQPTDIRRGSGDTRSFDPRDDVSRDKDSLIRNLGADLVEGDTYCGKLSCPSRVTGSFLIVLPTS
jgi:hypothetical protein